MSGGNVGSLKNWFPGAGRGCVFGRCGRFVAQGIYATAPRLPPGDAVELGLEEGRETWLIGFWEGGVKGCRGVRGKLGSDKSAYCCEFRGSWSGLNV